MTRTNTSCLYAVEPVTRRLLDWMTEAVRLVISFYWLVFKVWGYFMLGGIALALIFSGVHDLRTSPQQAYFAVPGIVLGMAFFFSHLVRRFAWMTFGLLLVWFIPVTLVLMQFTDPSRPVSSWLLRIVLAMFYVLPPLLGAAMILHAEKASHKPRHPRWTSKR